jgi:predicted Zn-dependent protease
MCFLTLYQHIISILKTQFCDYVTRAVVSLLIIGQLVLPVHAYGFSIGEERMVGEQLLYTIRAQFKILDDPDISQYINDLGYQVLDVAGPQFFDYHFFVVKSDQFNAFAAPSGLIFFYTGLIKTMKSEDELLSVLAHEIGHVVSRHIANRMDKQGKITAATLLIGLASLALGNPALSQGLLTGSLAANQAISLSFSRQDEEQADRLSFGWMRAMQRNPKSMEGMLRTMRRITRYRTNKLPAYLLTHPNPEARLSYVQSLVEIDQNQSTPGYYKKTDNFDFLRFKYRVLSQAGEPEELRIYCANILASGRDPEQVTMAHYGLALLNAEDKNFTEAINQLELVRKKYPRKDILKVDLGTLYLDAGQVEQAVKILYEAYKRDPTDMYAAFQLAQAVEKRGEFVEAELLYHEVEKAMPEYSKLYYELGRLKANGGAQGISNFYLAKYYLYEGRIKYAKQYLKRASKDTTVPVSMQEEAKSILDRLKKLEEEL